MTIRDDEFYALDVPPQWWSGLHLLDHADDRGFQIWTIELSRRDGARAQVDLVDDGSGGLSVTVAGSDDADIDLQESSSASIMLHPRYLSPAGTDWNDRAKIWDAFARHREWVGYNVGPNLHVHHRGDGTQIVTGFAQFTGRLVYAEIYQAGASDSRRLLGVGKLDHVLAAIRNEQCPGRRSPAKGHNRTRSSHLVSATWSSPRSRPPGLGQTSD